MNYPIYFPHESATTLAEDGEYVGADAIEEYVKFATSASPYFLSKVATAQDFGVAGLTH